MHEFLQSDQSSDIMLSQGQQQEPPEGGNSNCWPCADVGESNNNNNNNSFLSDQEKAYASMESNLTVREVMEVIRDIEMKEARDSANSSPIYHQLENARYVDDAADWQTNYNYSSLNASFNENSQQQYLPSCEVVAAFQSSPPLASSSPQPFFDLSEESNHSSNCSKPEESGELACYWSSSPAPASSYTSPPATSSGSEAEEPSAAPVKENKPVRQRKRESRPRRPRFPSGSSDSSSASSSFSSPISPPSSPITPRVKKAKITKFLGNLLASKDHNPAVMTWVDKSEGRFRITDQAELARLWGAAKNNDSMTYEKLR